MAIAKTSAKFRKSGDTLDYTPSTAIAAGSLVVVGSLVGLALWPIASGEAGTLKTLHSGEVIEVTTDEAIGQTNFGTPIYVTSAGLVSKTESGNTLVGFAASAIGESDKTFEIVCA